MNPTAVALLPSAPGAGDRPGPLRRFIATENLGAVALVAATLVALVWANSPWAASYETVWTAEIGVRISALELAHSLRDWVNEGLMAVFFFVAGLEIRREFDMGELRERRRLTAPVLAAVGGMAVPALLYLAITAGTDWTGGWGIVMGTDTAFALAVLSLTRGVPPRVRTFLLTLVVIDDAIALTVIAVAYTDSLSWPWLAVALAVFGLILMLYGVGIRYLPAYALLAVGVWLAVSASGLHATIAGVAVGLVASAYPPGRDGLRRAGAVWRRFRIDADTRARPAGQSVDRGEHLSERDAAAAGPPLVELPGGAAVRVGQRGFDARRRRARAGGDLSHYSRDRRRAGGRQGRRHRCGYLADFPARVRRPCPDGDLALAGRGRRPGRDRLHRFPAHRRHLVRRR